MMFVCCPPSLSGEAQVAVILKILCGFSVTEIARAFVCNYSTIEKRLYRSRQSLKENRVAFELPAQQELDGRLENVLTAIYLLFNEGYNSTCHDELIRNDLVEEAMRLCELICKSSLINHGAAHALLSLMNFTAARTKARLDSEGNILLLKEQDRSKWDREHINKGIAHLERSAVANQLSKYHIEAGIAMEHAKAVQYCDTNWNNILHYYDVLYKLQPSPVIALNRAIVVAELHGAAVALACIESIHDIALLKKYYLLPATLGELYGQLQQYDKADSCFKEAITLTQSPSEKKLLQQKLAGLKAVRQSVQQNKNDSNL
jgi:RNA polymerase sigma-70 factor (ECF subfamily)